MWRIMNASKTILMCFVQIKLTDSDTEEEHVLYADCWISAEAGLGKEFPIVRPESRPLPGTVSRVFLQHSAYGEF